MSGTEDDEGFEERKEDESLNSACQPVLKTSPHAERHPQSPLCQALQEALRGAACSGDGATGYSLLPSFHDMLVFGYSDRVPALRLVGSYTRSNGRWRGTRRPGRNVTMVNQVSVNPCGVASVPAAGRADA